MARVPWQATSSHTSPASSTLAAGAIVQRAYDATLDLGEGQAATAASVQLIRLDTLDIVADGATLDDPPIVDNVILFAVTGVEANTTYRLRIGFDHTNPRVPGERTIRLHVIEGVG